MKTLLLQTRQLWQQLGINQRVSIGVAAIGVVVGMMALLMWSQRPQMQLLYGGLSQKDMSAVMSALQEAGIKADVGPGGNSVSVPSDQVHKVRMQLATKGVPSGEGVGYEIFDRTNFGISDFVQRTNKVRALQGELSRTVAQLQGVRSAKVLIVMPENRLLFTDAKTKPTASVFVEGNLNTDQVNSIRFLVANAVEDLKADDVAVVDHKGQVLTEGLKDDPVLGAASGQMRLRKNLEDYFQKKVESMLASVLGVGQAVVRVSADLDSEATTRNEEKYDPDGQVVRTETSVDDSTVTNETEQGGQAAGTTANTPANQGGGAPVGKNSQQSRKNKSTNYEINRVLTSSVKTPGSVARLTAAVFVAKKGDTDRGANEKTALKKIVANALGVKAASDAEVEKMVALEEVSFPESKQEMKSIMEQVVQHSDLVRDAGAILVALVVIGGFVRMLRKTKPEEVVMEQVEPAGLAGREADAEIEPIEPEAITVEKINEMIKRRPTGVAAAIKNWISRSEGSNS